MSTDAWANIPRVDPGDHAHLAERVAAALRSTISGGAVLPGTKLPEVRLTAQLGVSRHTLRSAFQQLAGEGLVERQPNRGVFVHSPTAEDVREIYRVRRIVETGALRAADFSSESIARLQEIVDEAKRARADVDVPGMGQANQQFHRLIIAQAHSATLDTLMSQILARMRLVFHTRRNQPDFHSGYVDSNAQLAELIGQGRRQEAENFLIEYLSRAESELLEHMGKPAERVTRR
ncbi:GntR family transcriptional regulator [Nesterenkonia rhizosphaerae]|uniref:GntR family transcriptional regulator n=1 Tax=Nesterenkonia rhizosphaerae TaxID=1348272 RepID=A0ABP9FYY3_9MICC